jgi:E3 ubiquitin-protein ligase RNF13/E3 ubiquitin-protein ligase RNF167
LPDPTDAAENPSTSHLAKKPNDQPWFESQLECAICLSEFTKGDKVRVLPCHHIFHLNEIDEWLIQRKKLVRSSPFILQLTPDLLFPPVPDMQS